MSVVEFPQAARCAICGSKEVIGTACLVNGSTEKTEHFCRDHQEVALFSPPDAFDVFARFCMDQYEWLPADDAASILFDIRAALAAIGCAIQRLPQGSETPHD